ncbi:MAG TPA: phosphoribosylanthranilate isomerase [Candidatus Avidesulfovibrio excrementigallinarum]|nr:phosphoribosylanthranilate isomerase [Candidatus Avidesulfovibrio excrementigallinarum]
MRIKICGMSDQAAIDAAAGLGVDMCGFVFHASSPRAVALERVRVLDTRGMARVGVFVRQTAEETAAVMELARLDYVQLHGRQDTGFAGCIPAARIIRVFNPAAYAGTNALQAAIDAWAGCCGLYLLDAGAGSGQTLDWAALARLRFPRPWLLAGGLDAHNVAGALRLCRPDGCDFNSRLEDAPGHKDPARMRAAVQAVRAACQHGPDGF